ncbi:MAG: efflux RND transporter periplasmic adaptor subunit [Verrucomicrobiota bacterium]|nr:efflux RND transporter periplasmic adaptor subunit [Verrucomicrobiota bacterium]
MSTSTTMDKASVATRERGEHLERRIGGKKLYVFGGIILLVVLALSLRGVTGKKRETPSPAPRTVETAKVLEKDVPLYLDEIGTCAAFETVQVQAQVAGKILQRHFEDGAEVKKGDLLFTIDSRPYEATLNAAKADLALAQVTLQRQNDLRAKNVTSNQDLDTARANAQRAEAAVASAQVNYDYCFIKSPIDGRTGIRNVDVGNVVGPGGATSLVTIQGLDPIYTDFVIAEPDVQLVRQHLNGPKLEVLTDAEDDSFPPRSGQLSFIDNAVQPGSGTVRARAITPNPDRALWPSQFVRVRLILETLKGAKLVPSGAVQTGQNGPYIFVVKPDSTLDLRQVKSGQRQGDLIVVREGVQAGESVVVSGQLQLAPGAKVVAKPVDGGPTVNRENAAK